MDAWPVPAVHARTWLIIIQATDDDITWWQRHEGRYEKMKVIGLQQCWELKLSR